MIRINNNKYNDEIELRLSTPILIQDQISSKEPAEVTVT